MSRIAGWFQKRRQRRAAWPKNVAVLYLLCIIIPLIATDTVFVFMLIQSRRADINYSYAKTAGNMAFQFGESLDNAYSIILNITKNDEIEDFLERDYESGSEYYEEYRKVMNNKFLKALCSINNSSLEIYTDNPTIINGGGIYNINRISDYEWYKDYIGSGRDSMVEFYYDIYTGPSAKPVRKLMLIRSMDYFSRARYRKICVVVMDYGQFARSMESASADFGGFISDDEKAYVFTDGNNNIYDDFIPLSAVRHRIGYSRDFEYAGSEFKINIIESIGIGFSNLAAKWPLFLFLLAINAVFPIFFAKLSQTVQIGKLKEQEMDIARQQAELLALHSQINPHFLFNALESIRMHSVLRGEDETAEMVEKLAVIERKNADWNDDNTTIENEMEFVDAYLKLQQYRFGDRLSYEIDVEENCKKIKIPKLSIVTFVENACVHGIEGKSSPGWIFVRVYNKGSDMVIEIEDTGEGLSDEDLAALREKMENASIDELKKKGRIGVVNACLRLKIATSGHVRFLIETEKGIGTTVTVIIPREYTDEKSIAR
ncbi:MAG: histidine kinase [Lachnospiraceae bacterium]|nr:histidine kinase [Lachnospiraceae bacterium]